MNNEPVAWMVDGVLFNSLGAALNISFDIEQPCIPLYTHPVKELTDEEWNQVFDFYCETDEGVLRFDYELRDEWKKEQLIRWKEALRKAQEK